MIIKIKEISALETYKLRHEVMWPDKPIDFLQLDEDESGRHFGLITDVEVISIISLFVNDRHAQFRKFATKTSEQGKGYGTILLNYLITSVTDKNIERLWCNARVDKTSYYENFGMTQTGNKFTKEGVNYVVMEKIIKR